MDKTPSTEAECYPICDISSLSDSLSIESAISFCRTTIDAPSSHGRRRVSLTEDADYVSTGALIRAPLSCFCNTVHPLLVYGLIGVVQSIYDFPELSDVGVWCYLGEESTKPWGADLYNRRYEAHEPLKRK